MTLPNSTPVWRPVHKAVLATLLLAQFSAAWFIGSYGLLANTGASLFAPITITAIFPVLLFLAGYNWSSKFRAFVLAQDLFALTILQLWRIIGFVFLALYAIDALPGLFALPAGFGDVAVGIIAAFIALRLKRDPDFATSPTYVQFHLLGLLDFVVAIGTAALASGAIPGLVSGGPTTGSLDVWPLNLFPSFIVPSFIILQLAALLKVRALRQRVAPVPAGIARTA